MSTTSNFGTTPIGAAQRQNLGGRGFNGDDNDMIVDQHLRAFDRRGDLAAVVPQQDLHIRNSSTLVPCFTTGTAIATARGAVRVEDLVKGDMIVTRDNGLQELRWVGCKEISGAEISASPDLTPVIIRAGALGDNLPANDMIVSPNHRVLIAQGHVAKRFGETELLVAAKYLVGMPGVERAEIGDVGYHHFMFDRHEVVLSNGAWTESFQPADGSLGAIDADQRRELLAIFPSLENEATLRGFDAARRSVRPSELGLLTGI